MLSDCVQGCLSQVSEVMLCGILAVVLSKAKNLCKYAQFISKSVSHHKGNIYATMRQTTHNVDIKAKHL